MPQKKHMARPGIVPFCAANNLTPKQYLACLCWLATDAPYKTARKQAGVSVRVRPVLLARIRSILWLSIAWSNPAQLGGEGKLTCIDETWLTKKKRSKGGFQGRCIQGTKTIVLGIMEINFESRRATGNCIVLKIPDRSARTVKRFINTHVVPGSLFFTDSFKGYAWLSRPNSGFVHRCRIAGLKGVQRILCVTVTW